MEADDLGEEMKRSALLVFSLFSFSLILCGCSSLDFKAGGRTPFKIATAKNSDQSVEIEGSADFFFWGLSPGVSKIDFEDLDQKLGLTQPSFVTVEQYVGLKSFFFTAITLGLYCPLDYKIKVLSIKVHE